MVLLRPSDVTSWTLCPKRVEYKNSQRLFPSYDMTRGTLLHHRIEAFLTDDVTVGYDYAEAYRNIVTDDTALTVDDFELPAAALDRMYELVQFAFNSWFDTVRPHIEQYGDDITIEHRLERELPSGHMMGGTPDLVAPDYTTIVDWKTARRAWKDVKAQGQLQPAAYTWLNGWKASTFTFWVFGFKEMEWEAHSVFVTPEMVDAWVQLADDVALSIEARSYPATPMGTGWTARGWHCSPLYCSAWTQCNSKHMLADGKSHVEANPMKAWLEA